MMKTIPIIIDKVKKITCLEVGWSDVVTIIKLYHTSDVWQSLHHPSSMSEKGSEVSGEYPHRTTEPD
jgi:hypothetical protein